MAAKKSLVVTLTLSPTALAQFSDTPPEAFKSEPSPSVQPPEQADKSSDSNSTPVPSNGNDPSDPNSLAPPKGDGRKKRGGAAITGRKRAPPSIDPNAPPRERGRPGPKKKPRLPDGTIDRSLDAPAGATAAPAAAPAHKLGPKANTGAINAGLRALDRSGKPCRRWEKKGLQLKSFTGTMWGLTGWKAPLRPESNGENDFASEEPAGSSNIGSERSGPEPMNGVESSPAPAPIAVVGAA